MFCLYHLDVFVTQVLLLSSSRRLIVSLVVPLLIIPKRTLHYVCDVFVVGIRRGDVLLDLIVTG